MRNTILAATCVAALSTFTSIGAFAQTWTSPAPQQDNMGTTGMNNNGMPKDWPKTDIRFPIGMETGKTLRKFFGA
jgi:hypothetical protein